jgi:Cu/Ag efflux protein CusF
MKTLILSTLLFSTIAIPVFAAGDMAGMEMGGMKTPERSSGPAMPSDPALTDALVKRVDASTGMITLQHGALNNVGMPPMTMAFKAKDPAMTQQVHEGDKVKVRIENIKGNMTIVRMEIYSMR